MTNPLCLYMPLARHERFRGVCVSLAQRMHRGEVLLRTNILGEPSRQHVRPLSEARYGNIHPHTHVNSILTGVTRAIENGANALAEGFLCGVATLLILGETWRSSRSQSQRRDSVDVQLEELSTKLEGLSKRVEGFGGQYDERWEEEKRQ